MQMQIEKESRKRRKRNCKESKSRKRPINLVSVIKHPINLQELKAMSQMLNGLWMIVSKIAHRQSFSKISQKSLLKILSMIMSQRQMESQIKLFQRPINLTKTMRLMSKSSLNRLTTTVALNHRTMEAKPFVMLSENLSRLFYMSIQQVAELCLKL